LRPVVRLPQTYAQGRGERGKILLPEQRTGLWGKAWPTDIARQLLHADGTGRIEFPAFP